MIAKSPIYPEEFFLRMLFGKFGEIVNGILPVANPFNGLERPLEAGIGCYLIKKKGQNARSDDPAFGNFGKCDVCQTAQCGGRCADQDMRNRENGDSMMNSGRLRRLKYENHH